MWITFESDVLSCGWRLRPVGRGGKGPRVARNNIKARKNNTYEEPLTLPITIPTQPPGHHFTVSIFGKFSPLSLALDMHLNWPSKTSEKGYRTWDTMPPDAPRIPSAATSFNSPLKDNNVKAIVSKNNTTYGCLFNARPRYIRSHCACRLSNHRRV